MSTKLRVGILLMLIAAIALVIVARHHRLTGDDLTAPVADRSLPRLVDLGSTTCTQCKKMFPVLDELAAEYRNSLSVEFIDVKVDREASQEYNIRVIPTQIFFAADGKELYRHEGFISKADILARWSELGVDLSMSTGGGGE